MSNGNGKTAYAISERAFQQYGCWHCHTNSVTEIAEDAGNRLVECLNGECGIVFVIRTAHAKWLREIEGYHIHHLPEHLRRKIPCHQRLDNKSDGDWEFFRPEEISPTTADNRRCFGCGVDAKTAGAGIVFFRLTASVKCRLAGKRIVKMFEQVGSFVRLIEHNSNPTKVGVDACNRCHKRLELLFWEVQDGIVTSGRIRQALACKAA